MEVGSSSTSLNYSSTTYNDYDVFINFRGENTRNTIVGHLYEKLHKLGLVTFMDDKILSIGDDLNEMLVKAIEDSKFFIVVLSEHYASSKWCLRELVKIIECSGQIIKKRIFPVFYHVSTSDVRKQSGSFEQSFDHHQEIAQEMEGHQKERYLKEIQSWRDCLTRISDLTGEVITKDSSEVESLKRIAKQIFVRCKVVPSQKHTDLFEIDLALSEMNKLLDLEMNNDDVHFVGILGMFGIGKTTLAEIVYNNILLQFWENSCFLRVDKKDSVLLQRQLLCTLLRERDIEIYDEKDGAELIKRRLSGRKVLIVLDGVENKTQLETLAGSLDWFGAKSRVIITTRDKGMFHQPNYGSKIREYNVKLLTYENAVLLFSKHALGKNNEHCDESLKVLCNEIVKIIGGLPLALIEFGNFLHGKGKDIWEEQLESLRKARNKRLLNILKLCFDGLEEALQQVFLDLACFFHGSEQDKVVRVLESLDYEPHTEMQMLSDCFFIEVSQGSIYMPNFIQAMGQQIELNATKRTRVWIREDLHTVFDELRVEHLKGIVLDLNEMADELESELEASLFNKMRYLRILEIGEVKLDEDLTYLSKQLRFLNWRSYPSEYLPSNFESPHLYQLSLPSSQTTKLWEGQKRFAKLKVIDARDSQKLEETPDFSKVPKLERLILRNCARLHTIDSSISTLNYLVYLDLTCCVSLKNCSSIYKCKKLTHRGLQISGSSLDGRNTPQCIWNI